MQDLVALERPLAEALRDLVRQWITRGKTLDLPRGGSAQRGGSAPIVHEVRVSSGTADADGYPCLVRERDGTSWSEPYQSARIIHPVAGATYTTDDVTLARLIRVTPAGMLVYVGERVSGSEIGLDLSGRTGSIANVTALQVLRAALTGTAGAAVFTPDNASTTLPGDVSTGAQTFAGDKSFTTTTPDTGVLIGESGKTWISGTSLPQMIITKRPFSGIPQDISDWGGFPPGASLSVTAASNDESAIETLLVTVTPGWSSYSKLSTNAATGLTTFELGGGSTNRFRIGNGAAVSDGFTGTGGGGDTIVGGLVVGGGSGASSIDGGTF